MRVLSLVSQPFAEHAPTHPRLPLLPSAVIRARIDTQIPTSQIAGGYPLWWAALQGQSFHRSLTELAIDPASTSLEALKTTKLTLNLWRQGRQIAAELSLAFTTPSDEAAYPVTLFTGS